MDLPDLVRQAVGDEEIRAGVTLGDEDAIVFTPTRALVYRGEGLLSDEDVSAFGFDFERLAVSEGRRKTKFTMSYVEGKRSFSVPGKRTDDVLSNLIEGTLRVAEAIDASESVTGVFRFSEMTVVVAEKRLLKHIGEYTWDDDFEAFPYDDLTRLSFEEGSVATQVVMGVGTRSERIKAPNAEAGLVRKNLQQAVFSHYDVGSIEELNREIAVEDDEDGQTDATGGLGLDSGIDPLVSDDPDEAEAFDPETESTALRTGAGETESAAADSGTSEPSSGGSPSGGSTPDGATSRQSASSQSGSQGGSANRADSGRTQSQSADTRQDSDTEAVSVPSVEADDEIREQLADLTQAVERQNELLHRQQQTVEKLIEELRQGR